MLHRVLKLVPVLALRELEAWHFKWPAVNQLDKDSKLWEWDLAPLSLCWLTFSRTSISRKLAIRFSKMNLLSSSDFFFLTVYIVQIAQQYYHECLSLQVSCLWLYRNGHPLFGKVGSRANSRVFCFHCRKGFLLCSAVLHIRSTLFNGFVLVFF